MVKARPIDPLSFLHSRSRGDGKVTIGITGLWRLSDHSDASFFDPSMSALPVTVVRKSLCVGLFNH